MPFRAAWRWFMQPWTLTTAPSYGALMREIMRPGPCAACGEDIEVINLVIDHHGPDATRRRLSRLCSPDCPYNWPVEAA